TKCQNLGSISSRHFRRIVKLAKEKFATSITSLPLQTRLIPSLVNINSIVSTESLTPSINTAVFNCHDGTVLNVEYNDYHLENPSLIYSEVPNLMVSNLVFPNLNETITDNNNDICDKLRNWTLHFKITHNAANSLLTIMQSAEMKVPKDELPNNVLPIGIFHGFKKPHSIEEFLNPFVVDTLEVLRSGLNINGTVISVNISNIVCNAPAKSFLLNFKNFNAYFGCTSCIEEGEYIQHRVALIGTDAPLRTNETFRNQSNKEYHKGKRDIRLTDEKREGINNDLKMLRPYVPSELCRLPRPIDDIEFWKATELRSFVLYSGAIVLKGKLKPELYKHFLLLVFATKILVSPETCYKYNSKASKLLLQFVNDYGLLYGHHHITYNVHSLIHLPFFTLLHGPLDNFSSFRYENYLQYIKKSIKGIKYPLQEVYNRIKEKQLLINDKFNLILLSSILCNEIDHQNLSFLTISDKLYRKCIFECTKTTIDVTKEKDNYFLCQNNSLITIQYVIKPKDKPIKFMVKRFLNVLEFCNKPLSSFIVGMFVVDIKEL
ncbi:DUF4806 domain-containing protein, partial [Aphis craccivora]